MDFEDKMHRQQFEEMYNQYQTPLRKLAYRYNVPVDDIEDMVTRYISLIRAFRLFAGIAAG